MSPSVILAAVAGVTGMAYALERVRRRRSGAAIRALAAEWRMNFGQHDTLRITPRVAGHFPIPGAANLRVFDVIYGTDRDRYRYIFTAEYTAGVVNARRRLARVGAFSEPRDRERGQPPTPVVLAPANLPRIEQYRSLAPCTQKE